jgi:hypothetical protein
VCAQYENIHALPKRRDVNKLRPSNLKELQSPYLQGKSKHVLGVNNSEGFRQFRKQVEANLKMTSL